MVLSSIQYLNENEGAGDKKEKTASVGAQERETHTQRE